MINFSEFTQKDFRNLPTVLPRSNNRFFTVILLSEKKNVDGYSPITVVLTTQTSGAVGKMEFHPDSISMEPKLGVTWHMDSLPKSGAMQIWATEGDEFKALRVWGAGTLYIEAC